MWNPQIFFLCSCNFHLLWRSWRTISDLRNLNNAESFAEVKLYKVTTCIEKKGQDHDIFNGKTPCTHWNNGSVYSSFHNVRMYPCTVWVLGAAVRIISTLAGISTPDLSTTKQEYCILCGDVRNPYHLWKMIQLTRTATDILQTLAHILLFRSEVKVRCRRLWWSKCIGWNKLNRNNIPGFERLN